MKAVLKKDKWDFYKAITDFLGNHHDPELQFKSKNAAQLFRRYPFLIDTKYGVLAVSVHPPENDRDPLLSVCTQFTDPQDDCPFGRKWNFHSYCEKGDGLKVAANMIRDLRGVLAEKVGSKERAEFISYCYEFYGPNGVYSDYDMTREELELATSKWIDCPDYEFEGDSIDRERVRDTVLRERGVM